MACPANSTYDSFFRAAAAAVGVDPALVKAHAAVETGYRFDPRSYRAEPRIGDASYGLLQLLYRTALALGYQGAKPTDQDRASLLGLYAPAVNIPLGAQLIAQNLQGAAGDMDVAIAAYNEGLTRALEDRATGTGAWRTTDPAYVQKVRACWAAYAPDFADTAAPPEAGPSPATEAGLTPGRLALVLAVVAALLTWGLKKLGGHS